MRLCPWSLALASSIPVLGLESVCPRKSCPWPWPRIFLCPWPWPRALCPQQRWSPRGRPWPRGRPRGQILKSLALALASKVKSLALALASRPQVLENWPVLGSRTALFFGMLKFCGTLEKFFGKRFLVEIV